MAAFTALDRPGPLDMSVRQPRNDKPLGENPDGEHNMLVEYARRARGEEGSKDIMPVFDEMLPETYGVMVYQEQLQRMYQQLTGCSGPDAEEFRKNVAKKKKEKIDKAYLPFIEAASKKIGKENAEEAWKFFITWAKYGFNKSHAVCYAVIGYACAYLKHHFPLEWWTAVLRNASKNEVGEKFWRHCGNHIDLPDVKLSGENFEIQGERIRSPLSLLQGVGEAASKQLKQYTPYVDIADFCQKINKHQTDTGTWEDKTKIKKERRLNPETGRKESIPVEVPVRVLKRGYNALNRGVVQSLILGGAMDSLFPSDTFLGDQLNLFEDALSAATGQKRKVVDQKLWDVGPLQRYQMKKEVLPVYGCDLIPYVKEHFDSDFDGNLFYRWEQPHSSTGRVLNLRVANATGIENYKTELLGDQESITVAVAAYVEDQESRPYKEKTKEFCKFILNIDGARFEVCTWPRGESKKPDQKFYQPLKGAVIVAVLNRYGNKRADFSLSDLRVVQPPLGSKEEEKEDAEVANAG
jgi:hypothetical protein